MGHVLRKLGRYPDAIEFHKKALHMSPQNAASYSSIGFIYCMMGRWRDAVEALDYVGGQCFLSSLCQIIMAHILPFQALGLNKLLRRDDPHTKTLLESHALKNYPAICRHALSFTNKFNDRDYVDKLCEQTPKKVSIKSKKDQSESKFLDDSSMDIEMPSFLNETNDSTLWNNSLRIL